MNHHKGHFKRSERSNLAPFFTWRQFSQKLFDNFFSIYAGSFTRRVLMNCQKIRFDWITLKVIFEGSKGVKFGCFNTFYQFSQKHSDNFYLFLIYSFLGMILINCQEMDFIELFKRSFSRSERSGLAHFPLIIDIIQ